MFFFFSLSPGFPGPLGRCDSLDGSPQSAIPETPFPVGAPRHTQTFCPALRLDFGAEVAVAGGSSSADMIIETLCPPRPALLRSAPILGNEFIPIVDRRAALAAPFPRPIYSARALARPVAAPPRTLTRAEASRSFSIQPDLGAGKRQLEAALAGGVPEYVASVLATLRAVGGISPVVIAGRPDVPYHPEDPGSVAGCFSVAPGRTAREAFLALRREFFVPLNKVTGNFDSFKKTIRESYSFKHDKVGGWSVFSHKNFIYDPVD